MTKLHGKELQAFSYERPFDQSYIRYLLETLLSVARLGGQGFSKTTRANHVRRSHHVDLTRRVEMGELSSSPSIWFDVHTVSLAGVASGDATYQDVLFETLVR